MSGIFLNYRTVDAAFGAAMLDETLVTRFGEHAVFRDNRSIPLAANFTPILWKRLRTCAIILVLIGPHWLTESLDGTRLIDHPDDFVRQEIDEAFRLDIDVLPVLLGDTPLPKKSDLPSSLERLSDQQAFPIRARDPRPDIDRLADRLAARDDLTALPTAAVPQSSEGKGGLHIGSVSAGRDAIVGNQTNNFHGSVSEHYGRDEGVRQD
jgi:hypothetical protein